MDITLILSLREKKRSENWITFGEMVAAKSTVLLPGWAAPAKLENLLSPSPETASFYSTDLPPLIDERSMKWNHNRLNIRDRQAL
jgi:hypothetical protein